MHNNVIEQNNDVSTLVHGLKGFSSLYFALPYFLIYSLDNDFPSILNLELFIIPSQNDVTLNTTF